MVMEKTHHIKKEKLWEWKTKVLIGVDQKKVD